jgi:hypothetical protein
MITLLLYNCKKQKVLVSLSVSIREYKWEVCIKENSKKKFVSNRGDTIHYWIRTNYGTLLHSSMSTMDNTIQYHGELQARKLGQAPLLLFLTLRQTLSSHPCQQMVWMCGLQARVRIHLQYTKGTLSYCLCFEYFSQLSIDSEMYK